MTTTLDPIETASRDELQALQTERLKWTLKHAYENVPMYRRKFDAAGVHPDDFRELSDLSKFPCTTKQDLRDNYPFDTFAVPMEQVVRIHASSGTTGKPTVVGYTQNDIDTGPISWRALCGRRAVRRKTKSTSPTAMACLPAAGRALRRGTFRGHGDPDVRRANRETGAADS